MYKRQLKDGYDTLITEDGANLAAGQRQLLAIARAAVNKPPVLILDEATSSVDTRTEALIEQGMDKLMEGRTVFVIAHRLSTRRNANAIMVIENGRISERGAVAYTHLYPLQLLFNLLQRQCPIFKMFEQHTEAAFVVGAAYHDRQHEGRPLHWRTANLSFIIHIYSSSKAQGFCFIYFYYITFIDKRKCGRRIAALASLLCGKWFVRSDHTCHYIVCLSLAISVSFVIIRKTIIKKGGYPWDIGSSSK